MFAWVSGNQYRYMALKNAALVTIDECCKTARFSVDNTRTVESPLSLCAQMFYDTLATLSGRPHKY